MITPNDLKGRVVRVFKFLAEVARRRAPVVRRWSDHDWKQLLSDLPDHPYVSHSGRSPEGERIVLRVRRPLETPCPPRPTAIAEWIMPGWNDPTADARNLRTKVVSAPGGPSANPDESPPEVVTVGFEDDLMRVQAFADWVQLREKWRQVELPVRRVVGVFQRLFELRGRLERESERLALWLGDGILRISAGGVGGARPPDNVEYPLLLQRCELRFLPEEPAFEVRETNDSVELATAVLRELAADGTVLNALRERLSGQDVDLLESSTSALLTEAAHTLFPSCTFATTRAEVAGRACAVFRDPVVFVAERSEALVTAIEALIERILKGGEISVPVRDIVVAEEVVGESEESTSSGGSAASSRAAMVEPLLTRSSNAEQEEVLQQLHARGDVVVQGPPGTGKTHTIANLIGHFLAEGKSVLVTSQTTKALRVLRDKVVDGLRPLCVSVLDQDQESRSQLEQSVKGIIAGLVQSRQERARLAEQAKQERTGIKAALETVSKSLRTAIRAEYDDVVVGGSGFAPSEAARIVAREAGEFSWLQGPLAPGAPMPLAEDELTELYATNAGLTVQNESDLHERIPGLEEVVAPGAFAAEVASLDDLRKRSATDDPTAWRSDVAQDAAHLERFLAHALDSVSAMMTGEPLARECADAGRLGGVRREPWDDLVTTLDRLVEAIDRGNSLVLRSNPSIALSWTLQERTAVCEQLLAHARSGGALSGAGFALRALVRPRWRTFIKGSEVEGRRPADEQDLNALAAALQVESDREAIRRRWRAQLDGRAGTKAAELGGRPEDAARQMAAKLKGYLAWADRTWKPLCAHMSAVGLNWERLLDNRTVRAEEFGELNRIAETISVQLPLIVRGRVARIRAREAEQRISDVTRRVEGAGTSRLGSRLVAALRGQKEGAYEEAYRELTSVHALRATWLRRKTLLEKLRVAAPAWATAVERRLPPHDQHQPPQQASRAWLVRQLQEELTRRAALDSGQLQKDVSALRERLQEETSRYVESLAWSRQHDRVGRAEQAALRGWLATVSRRGYESGLRSTQLKAAARDLLGKAKGAVPVWVMPLSRVVESYDFATTKFDVVIVDEASQCDMTGLVTLGIADRAVVVGDDKQVSPVAVGEDLAQMQTLIDEFLPGVSNAQLYTGRHSLYDMAGYGFGRTIRLTEHFRCVPDIIQFSNELSYDGEIKPLRESGGVMTRPFVVNHRVLGGVRAGDSKTNEAEAEEIVSLIAALCESPPYKGCSIGVISLLGEEQSLLIDAKVRERIPATELAARGLLCGISAQFQGDERDVVFLSMVDSPREGGPLRSNANNDDLRKRYNVAASRARDQLWVVHSLTPGTDLQAGDLRRRLLEHALDPTAAARQAAEAGRRAESEFERRVSRSLSGSGYRLVPQWRVGALRIDMVVIGANGQRVALECDGDRYHPPEMLEHDLKRQEVLERLGWRFVRIRGTAFFRDPEASMAKVRQRLGELDILPIGAEAGHTPSAADRELLEAILRRATELRATWRAQAAAGGGAAEEVTGEPDDANGDGTFSGAGPDAASEVQSERSRTESGGKAVDAERVLSCLREAARPLGRQDILSRTGIDLASWPSIIRTLVESHRVVRAGDRRGAKYSLPQRGPSEESSPPPTPAVSSQLSPCARAIVAALRASGRAMTKADLVGRPGIDRAGWSDAISELYRLRLVRRAPGAAEIAHELTDRAQGDGQQSSWW